MNNHIKIISHKVLKQHERTDTRHLRQLLAGIKSDGYLDNPIIVDRNTQVILDGHHRFSVIKSLGLTRIPVYFVDYRSDDITVRSWRENEKVLKDDVIRAGLTGNLLRPKTSRHHIPQRPTGLKINLSELL